MEEHMDRAYLVEMVQRTAKDVFGTMLMMEAEAGEAVIPSEVPAASDGVVGIIGIAGSWVGTGIIQCQAPLACQAASAMMMAEYDSVNDEVLDAMGEVTNMIIGNLKTSLEERYGDMGISVPTVVYGRNFATRTVSRGEWIVVPFKIGALTMEVQVNLSPNQHADNHAGNKVRPGFQRTEPVVA